VIQRINFDFDVDELSITITITNEYYYGGAVALLLQDHLTMSLSRFADQAATTIYMSTTVQQEHKKTCRSTEKHSLNSTVFSSRRKATKVGAFLTRVSSEFQALAAAAGKVRSPSVERRVDGTSSVDVLADRR